MTKIKKVLAGLTLGLFSVGIAWTQEAATTASKEEVSEVKTAIKNLENDLTTMGLSAGLAVLTMNGPKEVKGAAPDGNGILRVDYEPSKRIGFILETHYLFGLVESYEAVASALDLPKDVKIQQLADKIKSRNSPAYGNDFSAGPTICVEAGENGIRSIGFGLMASFRRYKIANGDRDYSSGLLRKPFNLGFYYMVEPRVKTLAEEFKDGQPIPTGTALRFEEKSREGLAFVFSVSL